jgi:hypothetical protein
MKTLCKSDVALGAPGSIVKLQSFAKLLAVNRAANDTAQVIIYSKETNQSNFISLFI